MMPDKTSNSLRAHADNIENGASPSNPTLAKRLRKGAATIDRLNDENARLMDQIHSMRESGRKILDDHTNRTNQCLSLQHDLVLVTNQLSDEKSITEKLPLTADGVRFIPNLGQQLWWVEGIQAIWCCSCEMIGNVWINEHAEKPVNQCFSTKQAALDASNTAHTTGARRAP